MQALGVVDTDNDGRISAEEAQAHRERIFSALDADQNNALSRQETRRLTAAEPGYVVVTRMIPVVVTADIGSQMLSEMDQDQNQRISRQEYMQYGEQQFQQAQEQAGGQLTTGQAGEAQTGQMQAAQGGQAQTGQAQMGQGQTPEWQQVVRWRESNVDINDDGIIAADEAAAAWVDTFQRLDRNGDDQLTQDELEHIQAQKAMIDQRFAKLDTDGDGQIGLDEYASAGHDLMELADFNEDGVVTAWEYRAVRYTDQ
jgi:Ca2+-binding EF-hand superfamily protein